MMRPGFLDKSMSLRRPPKPIFIIGSYRSATSVTTWALGQHPNIFPLEETHFLYKIAVDLDYLHEIGSRPGMRSFLGLGRIGRKQFYRHFGQACDGLVRSSRRRIERNARSEMYRDQRSENISLRRSWWHPKRRWVDGTPENSHFVYPLLRMFPQAKFIHLLRNPMEVAASLMKFSAVGAEDYREEVAYRTWMRLVRDCALAELAFGSNRIMRVLYEDIVRDPKAVVSRCLEFVGEKYHSDCVLPYREKVNSSRVDSVGDCSIEVNERAGKPWVREAFVLYKDLLSGRMNGFPTPASARRALRRSFREYAESLRPDVNEALGRALIQRDADIEVLNRNVADLDARLKRHERPLRIVDFGPRDVVVGVPFNVQPGGGSAIWVRTENAGRNAVVELDGERLVSAVSGDGTLVTAIVPEAAIAAPRALSLFIGDSRTGERAGPEVVRVMARQPVAESNGRSQ